jgi:hypothetical protein
VRPTDPIEPQLGGDATIRITCSRHRLLRTVAVFERAPDVDGDYEAGATEYRLGWEWRGDLAMNAAGKRSRMKGRGSAVSWSGDPASTGVPVDPIAFDREHNVVQMTPDGRRLFVITCRSCTGKKRGSGNVQVRSEKFGDVVNPVVDAGIFELSMDMLRKRLEELSKPR